MIQAGPPRSRARRGRAASRRRLVHCAAPTGPAGITFAAPPTRSGTDRASSSPSCPTARMLAAGVRDHGQDRSNGHGIHRREVVPKHLQARHLHGRVLGSPRSRSRRSGKHLPAREKNWSSGPTSPPPLLPRKIFRKTAQMIKEGPTLRVIVWSARRRDPAPRRPARAAAAGARWD